MNEVMAVGASGSHKARHLGVDLAPFGIETRWWKIERDIPERVHHNPAKVLAGKLENNTVELKDKLRFWGEFGLAPGILGVFDVLGLSMTNVRDGQAPFVVAHEVLKKPEDDDAIGAISAHFRRKLSVGGNNQQWVWDAYVPGGAIAPVSKLGHVRVDQGQVLWDQAMSLGYSNELAEAFAEREMIERLLALEYLSKRVVSSSSIVGLKAQFVPRDLEKIVKLVPGAKMRIVYRDMDIVFEGDSSAARFGDFLHTVEGAMANSTPALAKMIYEEVSTWKNCK